MTNQRPITPPPELVQQWANESPMECSAESWAYELFIAHHAAQYGADLELEACCEYVYERLKLTTAACIAQELRAARRPTINPPSLKEQAYAALDTYIYGNPDHGDKQNTYNTIRRALEALPE
jgi:hypothetical protein